MAIGDDIEIQNGKDIRETGGTANYTVLELHTWLRGLADDATASPDDYMDITRDTPSDKAFDTIINLINGYNIDDTLAQRLYNGSIIQTDGAEIYDGIQVLAPEGMRLEVLQNDALATNFWTSCLNSDPDNGISHQFVIKVRTAGADIDGRRLIGTTREWGKTYLEYKINGTARGVNVMAFTGWTDDLNNTTASATVAGWSSIDNTTACFVGIDVDNDGTDENYYSEWNRDTYTINQFYERMKYLQIRGTSGSYYGIGMERFRGISHQVAVSAITGGPVDAYEGLVWGTGTGQMISVDDITNPSTMWIQVLTGIAPTTGCTIESASTSASVEVESTPVERTVSTPFVGQSTGTAIIGAYGFGIEYLDLAQNDKMRALDNNVYQPPNNVTFSVGGLVAAEDYVNVTPLAYKFQYDTETNGPFVVDEVLTFDNPGDTTACLIDLVDNGTIGWLTIRNVTGSLPENNIEIAGAGGASALVNGDVNPTIDVAQFSLSGNASAAGTTCLIMKEPIPADTPSSGKIRVQRDNGLYTLHPYSQWTASSQQFDITSHDFSTNNASDDNNVYTAYIDVLSDETPESFTTVYDADRNLFIRVRDGGGTPIKTFETTGTLTSAGGTTTAVRTSDA
ncbi:MAG: hypothetical protein ACXABY_02410 [Candidatus Thorarchaeota archaeon]|jgi:hypothetical protein